MSTHQHENEMRSRKYNFGQASYSGSSPHSPSKSAHQEGNQPTSTKESMAPVTSERPVPTTLEKSDKLSEPWRPHATRAVDMDHPNGSGDNYPHSDMSVIQQHIKFWDLNNDGFITPWETYQGFRQLGFNILVSIFAVIFINGTLSYPTQDSWIPDPLFRIKVKNSHRIKHGSDTGVYDSEGRFLPAKFEELFTKYARLNPKYLTLREAFAMTEGLRVAMDLYGWIAAKLEWGTLFLLCSRRDPETDQLVISKEDMRAQYDGTLFHRMRIERRQALHQGQEYMPTALSAMNMKSLSMSHPISRQTPQAQAA